MDHWNIRLEVHVFEQDFRVGIWGKILQVRVHNTDIPTQIDCLISQMIGIPHMRTQHLSSSLC